MRLSTQVYILTALLVLLPCQVQAAPPSATRALSRELDQVKLDAIPLAEVVTLLADTTGANFHINWKALQGVGLDRQTAVTLHLRHVTVRKMLALMLEQVPATAPLSFFNDQGVIEVTTLELADLAVVTKVYNIEDLLIVAPDLDPSVASDPGNRNGANTDTETREGRLIAIVLLIRDTVEPTIWKENGGTASISSFNGNLIVTAPRRIHERIGGAFE